MGILSSFFYQLLKVIYSKWKKHICKLLKFHFISQMYYDFIIVIISDVKQQTREALFSEIN